MNDWNGEDRRKLRPGRRNEDRGVCPIHTTVAHECEKDKEEMRDKIETVFRHIDGLVTWRVFALLVVLSVTVIGSGFGYFGVQINKTNDLIKGSLDKTSEQISGLQQTMGVVLWRVESVEKRIKKENEN